MQPGYSGGAGSYANRSARSYNNNPVGAQSYNNNGVNNNPQTYNNNNAGAPQIYNNNAVPQQASNNSNAGSQQVYNNNAGSQQGYNNYPGYQQPNNVNINEAGGQQAYGNNAGGQQMYNNSAGGQQMYNNNAGGQQMYNNNNAGGQQMYNNNNAGGQQMYNNNAGGQQMYNNNAGGQETYNNSVNAPMYNNNNNNTNNNNNYYSGGGYNSQPAAAPPPPESMPPPPPPPSSSVSPPMNYQQQQQQQQQYGVPTSPPPPTSPPMNYQQQQQQQQQQYGVPTAPTANSMIGRYQQNYGRSAIEIEAEEQQRMLTRSIARVQEASHYMGQAMDRDDLSASLEKAKAILTELGDVKYSQHQQQTQQNPNVDMMPDANSPSSTLSPKNYYELHTLACQELPNLEEYFLSLFRQHRYSPPQLYEIVQYCPRAVPRLYLQICVTSAWIRLETPADDSGDSAPPATESSLDKKWLLKDLKEAVRCVQCPIRGLFLRYYMLQALRDKLPDSNPTRNVTTAPEADPAPPSEPPSDPPPVPVPVPEPAPVATGNSDVPPGDEATFMSNSTNLGDLLQPASSTGGFLDEEDIDAKMENININAPTSPPANPTPAPTPAPAASSTTTTDANPNSATVQDSYEFILSNLIEMNKLWVRIQHMPGDQRTKEARKKRERERNELRVLVGTNIVRLSELDEVTGTVYGTVILPKILDQIVACRDPLAQAYLMDCMIQVFPDEFHIQTLEVILGVCPRLRDKVNIRTILQGIMDRLSVYYADELLLNDEEDTEGVKTSVMLDTFEMFEDCIASVLEAKASKVTAREVIRLESSLLDFSLKCYPGRMDHVNKCLGVCASGLRGVMSNNTGSAARPMPNQLDDVAVSELEKLLSLPLESLALRVLELDHYSDLLSFLPFRNRKLVAVSMLKAVESSGQIPMDLNEIEQLFSIIKPLLYKDQVDSSMNPMQNNSSIVATSNTVFAEHLSLVAKLLHSLYHEDTDFHYDMLVVAKKHLTVTDRSSSSYIAPPLIFATLKLLNRIGSIEFPPLPPQQNVDEGAIAEQSSNKETVDNDTDAVNTTDDCTDESVAITKEINNEECNGKCEDAIEAHDGGSTENENNEESETKEVNIQGKKTDVKEVKESTELFKDDSSDLIQQPVPVFTKQTNCRKVFLFIQKTLAALKSSCPELCFTLTLRVAATADFCATGAKQYGDNKGDLNQITNEFMTQAIMLYETDINDAKYKPMAITSMVGTLLSLSSLENNEYEALAMKTTQYAARILKKTDQCKMVLMCSHLFFTGEQDGAYQNPQRVLECLQRSLKIADACTTTSPTNLELFVDILEKYVYFYERNNPIVTDKFISGLIALINEHIGSIGVKSAPIASSKSQLTKVIEYIEEKKNQTKSAEKFLSIVCEP